MTALIDADIVAYRCSAASENEGEEIALIRTDSMMMDILQNESDFIAFLSGTNNFRKIINPNYKANRKDTVRPQYLEACRDYLIQEYKAVLTDGYEADDALGFNQTEDTIIYSIDKDLLMIPGHHFNFVKKEYREISEIEGLKAFYRQMLIGDPSDNIRGVDGIGKAKAPKIIDSLMTEKAMFNTVKGLYDSDIRFWMNADCLWIMRKEGERFSDRYEKLKEIRT